jgi:hypothetical protein
VKDWPITRRIGPRGAVLLCFAWVDVVFGIGLIRADRAVKANPVYAFPEQVAPLTAWGVLWLAVAAVLIVNAYRLRDAAGYTCAIGIKVLWGVMMLGGWISGDIPRGYVSMSIWLSIAGVVAVCARKLPAYDVQVGR